MHFLLGPVHGKKKYLVEKFKSWLIPLLSLISVFLMSFFLPFNGFNAAAIECLPDPYSGKGEAWPLTFETRTWLICIYNGTGIPIEYQKRWGPEDPWSHHYLAPDNRLPHWCDTGRTRCIQPFMIKWISNGQEIQTTIEFNQINSGCLNCEQARRYYFIRNGNYIYLQAE